jgi:CheY-like chemotaxis protein
MIEQNASFGDTAQKLARNPLGIIALFIVLVYSVAGLVTATGSSLTAAERLPLIYFLVAFPILVLGVFSWLVSRHANKLFAPSDFRDEDNYVRTLTATASLAVASVKAEGPLSPEALNAVIRTVQEAGSVSRSADGPYWRSHILWVDDRPDNNINERRAFEAMGISFTLSLTTSEALEELASKGFAAIISDMGRKEGPREGYVLLDAVRGDGNQTPLFFYASSNLPEHKKETAGRGGQGCTNSPDELFRMVMRRLVTR